MEDQPSNRARIDSKTLENYQDLLAKDPKSKVFAALADAYRERKLYAEAELTAINGIRANPEYVGGYVALARLYFELKRFQEAAELLETAVKLSPENLLAYQLLGEVYLELKEPAKALKAYKMALLFNPKSESSKRAVKALESFTAQDYDSDTFQYRKLYEEPSNHTKEVLSDSATLNNVTRSPNFLRESAGDISSLPQKIQRDLSLLDALLVREELDKAAELARKLIHLYPESAEVRKRWDLVSGQAEEAAPLSPSFSREIEITQAKISALQELLGKIHEHSSRQPQL